MTDGRVDSVVDDPTDDLGWLAEFEHRYNRKLAVLHVGNIANNAYLNALILRRAGIDCHVLCYDYYDRMATPEWEAGEERDRWRPEWFVQGPQHVCLAYLEALADGRTLARRLLWARLALHRFLLIGDGGSLGATKRGVRGVARFVRRQMWRARRGISYGWSFGFSLARWAGRRAARALGFDVPEPPLTAPPTETAMELRELGIPAASIPTDQSIRYELRRLELLDLFEKWFPARADQLVWSDFARFSDPARWAKVFARYDIVQCYATDPIIAMVGATRPYVAFEHGTLRDFTMGADPVHRLNALAYREADHVFITNGDCLAYARALGIENYTAMVHPVDVDQHEADYAEQVAAIRQAAGADVLLLCPLRHDWEIKGTDVHIRALPEIQRRVGGRVVLMLCEWGAELEASRNLIQELGLENAVAWLPPLNRADLIAHMKAADVLLDQMALPHFGATAPQGLAAGVPVVMSYVPASTEWIVAEEAPILSAFDPKGVADAVVTALDPAWRRDFASRAYSWVHRYHHPRRIVREHARVYRNLVKERE